MPHLRNAHKWEENLLIDQAGVFRSELPENFVAFVGFEVGAQTTKTPIGSTKDANISFPSL